MTENQQRDLSACLALHHMPGIGPQRFQALLKHCSRPSEIFELSANELKILRITDSLRKQLLNPPWEKVEKDLDWQAQANNHILCVIDKDYPEQLKHCPSPPPVLYAKGNIELLRQKQIAIVGSRNASQDGLRNAYAFAKSLSASGVTITSGLALGIDGRAHSGALDGGGKTIAVIGSGCEVIYPKPHEKLADTIMMPEHGLLLSEYPPGTPPAAKNFPARNRIISGLSEGVLVIEASLKSGSLITARHALEQGREVFAIPGSIHNPLTKGCHALIRQGAKLVEQVEDILEELQMSAFSSNNKPFAASGKQLENLDDAEKQIFAYIGYASTSVDSIIAQSGLPSQVVNAHLLTLELKGHILTDPGGVVRNLNE